MSIELYDKLRVSHPFPKSSLQAPTPPQWDAPSCQQDSAKSWVLHLKSRRCVHSMRVRERLLRSDFKAGVSWPDLPAQLRYPVPHLLHVWASADPPWFFPTFKSPRDATGICLTVTSSWNTFLALGSWQTLTHPSSRGSKCSPHWRGRPKPPERTSLLPTASVFCASCTWP